MRIDSGAASRPYTGYTFNGDEVAIVETPDVRLYAVVDALGHGPDAAKSATIVVSALRESTAIPLRSLFEKCDRALVGVRGAVMSVIRVVERSVTFAGVGNVDIYSPSGQPRPHAFAGTLGGNFKVYREFSLAVAPGQRWILASDGLRHRDMPKGIEAVRSLPPRDAASELLSLAGRSDDDASVLILDFGPGWESP
jgi:phosphoserine phosphatase RsbX